MEDFRPSSTNQPGMEYPQVNSEGRAMAGLSMGAFETRMVTLNRPDVFSYYGLFSGGVYNPDDLKDHASLKLVFLSCGSKERPDGVRNSVADLKTAGGFQKLRHSLGLKATAATASLVSKDENTLDFVHALWDAKLEPYEDGYFDPYYDGLLYLFSLMHLSGQFQIITPDFKQ